jgi:hypothetical protein
MIDRTVREKPACREAGVTGADDDRGDVLDVRLSAGSGR